MVAVSMEMTLDKLVSKYPGLSDPATRAKAEQATDRLAGYRAEELKESDDFRSVLRECAVDACEMVMRDAIKASTADAERARDAGQPITGLRQGDGAVAGAGHVESALALLESGMPRDQVRAEINRRFKR